MRTHKRQQGNEGISLPELLIASFILILVVLNSVRMTTNALSGMGRSKSRSLVDVAIAEHIETLRKQSFDFLCTQGCSNDELTKALKYDLDTLKPLCRNTSKDEGIGGSFLDHLAQEDKPEEFSISTIPPAMVRVTYEPNFNRLDITYEADTDPKVVVSTTLVPHAQGWCP